MLHELRYKGWQAGVNEVSRLLDHMVFKVELIQTSVDVGLCVPVHDTNKGLLLPAQADALAFNSAWHRPALHLEKRFLINVFWSKIQMRGSQINAIESAQFLKKPCMTTTVEKNRCFHVRLELRKNQ